MPPAPKRTSTSGSSRHSSGSRPSSERRSSKKTTHANCDCLDCRDLSYREKQGSVRLDKNGDQVREWDQEEAPRMHVHVQPGLFDDEEQPAAPRRTGTNSSTRSDRRSTESRGKSNTSSTITKDGDHVEEWNGHEAPVVRTHYDWDAAEKSGH